MKKLLAAVLALAASAAMFAANPVELRLWPDGAPTSNGLAPDKENAENPDWIIGVSDPVMTVFPAEKPNGTALLMCPGGAYCGLAFKHEGLDMADDLNKAGITLAVLKYRMPEGHWEVPADDARRALALLREHASEWGINPDRVGIGGASAGGHLASTVATHRPDSLTAPNFQVLIYPVISMREGLTHQGSRDNLLGRNPSPELVDMYCNEDHVDAATPRAFIVATSDDDIVPVENSIAYFNALTKAGVPSSLHIYPAGGHGWAYTPRFDSQEQWVAELLHWLGSLY